MITFDFWGASHGEGYGGVIKGLPVGFVFDVDAVNQQLHLRKVGYGRSGRQSYNDVAVFDGQVDGKVTIGDEVRFWVGNHADNAKPRQEITALRAGHSDLVGQARHPSLSARQIAEMASARNSVGYVVLGAICKQIVVKLGIVTYSFVKQIGNVKSDVPFVLGQTDKQPFFEILRATSQQTTEEMQRAVDCARQIGDSLGGVAVVCASGVPMGIGEILPYQMRLDAQIAGALVGIPSVKGVTFGQWNEDNCSSGVAVADTLVVKDGAICYDSNYCGGIVGGVTTGQDVVVSLAIKPVPTVVGVQTVDSVSLQNVEAHYERADTCVVPNVGIIGENILAYVLTEQLARQGKL